MDRDWLHLRGMGEITAERPVSRSGSRDVQVGRFLTCFFAPHLSHQIFTPQIKNSAPYDFSKVPYLVLKPYFAFIFDDFCSRITNTGGRHN